MTWFVPTSTKPEGIRNLSDYSSWLVAGRGLSNKAAIAAVKQTGKNPYEAVIAALFKGRNPWKVAAELNLLLDECNRLRSKLS